MRTSRALRSLHAPLLEPLEPRALLIAVPTVAWSGPELQPISSVVGDVNHDGLSDTVVSSGSDIKLFINNGDGTFRDPTNTHIAGLVGQIALGHFNRDDNLDLISVGKARQNASRQYLRVLPYDATSGTFRITSRRPVGGTALSAGGVTQMAVADILPDGAARAPDDIALVVQSWGVFRTANVFVLSVVDGQIINSGAGGGPSISTPVRTLIGEVDSLAALALDPTAPAQLFIGVEHRDTTRTVAVSLTPRSGSWRAAPISSFSQTGISSFAAADMDADGRADILINTTPTSFFFDRLHNTAAAYFISRPATGGPAPRRMIGNGLGLAAIPTSMLGTGLRVLDVGDYDGDGFTDLVVLHDRAGSGYVNGPDASFTYSESSLVVLSTNPSVANRTLWSGYYRHDDPSNVTTGALFPNFVGAGTVMPGRSLPGLIGVLWSTTTELQVFATIPL